jgi:hypothetical protein
MPIETNRSRVTVEELVTRCRREMIPLTNTFSYFSAVPLVEDEVRQYLQEPIAALPPAIAAELPPIGVLLVPYLEKGEVRTRTEAQRKAGDGEHDHSHGRGAGENRVEYVVFERPPESRQIFSSRVASEEGLTLVFAIKEEDVADYHYSFYAEIASLVAENWKPEARDLYYRLLREELKLEVHGEVDERSWHLKQGLLRRQSNIRKETKLFRDYASQSFEDTLTLYLHGLCCDIEVETGPRQLPSRYLRKRLEALHSLYQPPEGYAVFP